MNFLTTLAVCSLILGGLCAIIILADIFRHPQQMKIMNVVYPVTALYAGPLALLVYYKIGRKASSNGKMQMNGSMNMPEKPFWQSVIIGALHCGSGCTLGDIMAEGLLFFVPVVLFGSRLAGTWLIDYVFAFVIGIVFQYYAIKPMKKLATGDALKAALKADTLSLTSWQIGMYGWMAITFFVIFGHKLEATSPVFWLMMQIAMLIGFLTAYPMNWWLIKSGIKEQM